MRWLVLLLVACNVPSLEDVGVVNDAGSCSVIVLPGTCRDVPSLQRDLEAKLPCNVCVSYLCGCETHTLCKVCVGERVDPVEGWGCSQTASAWCVEVP